MNVAVFLAIATLSFGIYCQDEFDEERSNRLKSELELIDWDLEDYCEDLTEMKKKVLFHKTSYKNKINLEIRYGGYVRNQTQKLLNYSEIDVSSDFARNYSVLVKPGDILLTDEDWKMLVKFRSDNDELKHTLKTNHTDFKVDLVSNHEYLNILSTSRNLSALKSAWSEWQLQVARFQELFPTVLQLTPKAASLHEQYDSKAYWEMLTDYENGYSTALNSWEEIKPLYEKLYNFVLVRINNYYKENFTEIPVYLTGSNFGEDWSNIADIILPHPQIYHDVKSELQQMSIEDIYKLSKKVGAGVSPGKTKNKLWSLRALNSSDCLNDVLYYCASGHVEILSCQNYGWSSYFTSHENALEIAVKTSDFTSFPRQEFRYSIIDDAVTGLGSIFAVHNLPYYGLLDDDVFNNFEDPTTNQMTALLLIALKILPKLPFYLAADMWRLEELEKPSEDITKSWWELRKKYQGVQGVLNMEADYMGDTYISSNKLYLSKFMGILLQFQILSYHQLNLFQEVDNIAERLGRETDFITIIQERSLRSTLDTLSYNYGFDGVNHYPLLDFFRPLEEYLDNAPLKQAAVITKPKKPKRVELPPAVVTEPEVKTMTTTLVENVTPEIPLQNDQHVAPNLDQRTEFNKTVITKVQETENSPTVASGHSGGMYIAITVGACLLIVLMVFIFKKVARMRRPRTNNRRFEA